MDINKLTKEELKYIIDNIDEIKSEYFNKYNVQQSAVYFRHESNKLYEYESLCIAVVIDIKDDMVHFSEFDIANDSFHKYDVSKLEIEFLEEFTRVEDSGLELELSKLYNDKKENINNIEKIYYLRAKDILHEYKLI